MYRNILIIMLFASSTLSLAQENKIALASDIWPPFTDSAGNTSFAIDIVKTALNRTGVGIENKMMRFSNVLESIQEGEVDGSAALLLSDERKEFMVFSDPYLHNQLIVVGRKGSDVSQGSLHEFEGKKVGIVENYAYGSSIEEAKGVEWVTGKSDRANLQALLDEDLDYMLVDALLVQYLLSYQKDKALQFIAVGENTLIRKSLHFAVRKDLEDADDLIRRFNNEIIRMVADGSYNQILHLNWIQADVDGDGTMELVLQGNRAGDVPPQNAYSIYSSDQGSADTKYYIGGSFYQSWDQVPKEYKQPELKNEDLSKIGIASFRF